MAFGVAIALWLGPGLLKLSVSYYLSLYRFPDGWKIVGKIFQPHGN